MHGNIIQLYSTTSFDNVLNLKGHNGKVRAVLWSTDDKKLISCGLEGAVYEWDVWTGKRVSESVIKQCSYTDVAVDPEGKNVFAVGSDKKIKQIVDSSVLRDVDMGDTVLTTVALSHTGKMLFGGTSSGALRCIKFPLSIPCEWQEHQAHSGSIVSMKVTFDDQWLVTVSEDASVMIWKVQVCLL